MHRVLAGQTYGVHAVAFSPDGRQLASASSDGTAPARDLCPATGRARLGYDRARILFTRYTGWQLHQLRHSAATHLGAQGIPLQLIMAKTRHRNPRTAMRYVRLGAEAVAEIPACSNLHADEAERAAGGADCNPGQCSR